MTTDKLVALQTIKWGNKKWTYTAMPSSSAVCNCCLVANIIPLLWHRALPASNVSWYEPRSDSKWWTNLAANIKHINTVDFDWCNWKPTLHQLPSNNEVFCFNHVILFVTSLRWYGYGGCNFCSAVSWVCCFALMFPSLVLCCLVVSCRCSNDLSWRFKWLSTYQIRLSIIRIDINHW